MPVSIRCGDPVFDDLPAVFADWLAQSTLTLAAGAGSVQGFKSGKAARLNLNDHARALWGGVFYDADTRSTLDAWLSSPLPDGSLFDELTPLPAAGEPPSLAFDDLLRHLRLWREPLKADSESWAVLAAHRAWQACNDQGWLLARLPVLERALEYSWTHPHRWSGELELPKREFTLDSWPVAFGKDQPKVGFAGAQPTVHPGVHPGDAAQLHRACVALARMLAAVGQVSDEEKWLQRAAHLQAQLNSVGWNGQFYTHQIHLAPVRVRGVDEARQLAACNAWVMNSGIASPEQCASVLREYQRRRELQMESSFCEWWSIHPPFPQSAFEIEPGQGANGGIWPLVGGELARAALQNGFESYGIETLRRYHELAVVPRRSWSWYRFDGTPGRDEDAVSHDVSGAASMLRALVEGVCGVRDDGAGFSHLALAPRWPATGQAAAEVEVAYASGAYVSYRWALDGGRMTLDYDSKAKSIVLDLMLPRGNTPERVALNGRTHPYTLATVEKSKYVRFETDKKRGVVAITLK